MGTIVPEYYFYKGLNPIVLADLRTILAIAAKSATDNELRPEKVLIQPLICEPVGVDEEQQPKPQTWRLNICYKNEEQLNDKVHDVCYAHLDEKKLLREATHEGVKEDGQTRYGGRCVWPDVKELTLVSKAFASSFKVGHPEAGRPPPPAPTAAGASRYDAKAAPKKAAPKEKLASAPVPAAAPGAGKAQGASKSKPAKASKDASDHSAIPPAGKTTAPKADAKATAKADAKADTKTPAKAKTSLFSRGKK